MREVLFRASSVARLMTEPKSKADGVLSVGAKTYIEEIEGKLNVTCAGMPANLHSQVTFENFTEGAKYGGKLRPVHTAGGIVLDETEFTVRKG